MPSPKIAPRAEPDEDGPYLMANIYPRHSSLPMTIWAGPRGGAKHDARIKVNMRHGDRMDIDNLAVVSIRPEPRLIEGDLSSSDLGLVMRWIEKNRTALIDHWEGRTDGVEFVRALQPL